MPPPSACLLAYSPRALGPSTGWITSNCISPTQAIASLIVHGTALARNFLPNTLGARKYQHLNGPSPNRAVSSRRVPSKSFVTRHTCLISVTNRSVGAGERVMLLMALTLRSLFHPQQSHLVLQRLGQTLPEGPW